MHRIVPDHHCSSFIGPDRPDTRGRFQAFLLFFLFASLTGHSQNYTSLLTDATFNRSIDVNLAVGATAGEAGVSPAGGSTYSIPIMTPPGTDGVVPSVSLDYNSQSGNGMLGMGWNIGGLSVVTRVGQSIYQDGQVSAVEMDYSDRFALDGARLVVTNNGSYGASLTTYATESESFAQVTTYNTAGVGGTGWFRVVTKEGTIMEYGPTSDGRLSNGTGNAPVLAWYLKKIKYPNGNYVFFIYTDQFNPRISEIIYTGNNSVGLVPYNKIQFNYAPRTDVNTVNEAGLFITNDVLLSSITVTADNQTVRTYELNYGFDNINSYLKEVVEKGSDGTQLNSTIFKYGDMPADFSQGGPNNLFGSTSTLASGDFNADGFTDVLETPVAYTNNGTWEYNTGFKLYKASETTLNLSITVDFPQNSTWKMVGKKKVPNYHQFLVNDFTGDLADDVAVAEVAASTSTFSSLKIYKIKDNLTSYDVLTIPAYPNFNQIHPSGKYIFPGDFNGDGIQDILTMLGYNNNYAAHLYFGKASQCVGTDCFGTVGLPPGTSTLQMNDWPAADQVFVLDFNGDGKSDLMVIKNDLCEIFTFEGYIGKRIYVGGFPTKDHLIYLGDFNGDHKTDLLVRPSLNNNLENWQISTSTGKWFATSITVPFDVKPTVNNYVSSGQFSVADFNGDGKTDIYVGWNTFINGPNFSHANLDVYYSRGNDFHFKRSMSSNCLSETLGGLLNFDINGDGRVDLVNRVNSQTTIDVMSFRRYGKENLLEKVANGLNHVTEFTYKRLNEDASFYSQSALGGGMWNNIKVPMPAVQQVAAQNGIGNHSIIQYSYEQARLHKQGKGFMGFAKMNTINLTMGIRTVAENTFWSYPYAPLAITPKKNSTYLIADNSLLSQTTYYVDFVEYGGGQYASDKRYWQRILSTTETNNFEGRTATTSYGYDSYGNVTQSSVNVQNGLGVTTTSTQYGQYGAPIPSRPTQTTVTRTRSGQPMYSVTTNFGYDGYGQLTSRTDFAGQSHSVQTTYGYDNKGNVTSTTVTPSGMAARTSTAVYDSKGQFATSTTDAMGHTASATYDPRWGQPLTQTGSDGLTTSYEYDTWGRLKKTNLPEGYSVNMTYNWDIDLFGTKRYYTHLLHPGKPDVKTWHDLLGREIRTETEGFQNQWVIQEKTYDAKGNVATTTQPYKSGETYQTFSTNYDNYNRPTIVNNTVGAFGQTNISYSYAGGNLTTTTIDPAGQSTAKVTDATGQVVQASDPGGTLNYTYNSQGNLLTVTKSGGGTLSSSQFDDYGRQTSLNDPNAGTTSYAYDALGQLISQTNANLQTSNLYYDLLGRNTSRTGPEGTTTYEYYPTNNGAATGRLKKVTSFAGNLEEYTYDGYGRLSTAKETVDGTAYQTTYGYNTYGDVTSKAFPSGFGTNHSYDGNGYPTYIRNGNNSITLYTNNGVSGLGVNTSYSLGNGKTSTVGHYYGIPTQYSTPGVQNLTMSWQYTSGNLLQRKDWVKGREENFGYDALNRLTSATVVGQSAQTVSYGDIGNINTKTDIGTYAYQSTHPNAVTSVTNPQPVIPLMGQGISYTAFAQPGTVTEGSYELNYTYGSDYNRLRSITKQNNNEIDRRYYFGDYGRDITGGTTRDLHYIGSPAGLIAIVVRENGSDTYHYTYTDHLGSILTVTNSSGSIEAEQSFDAWGRRRNASTWVPMLPTASTGLPVWLYRGYTSHEQLDQFGLINMNGRLYDPALGRVLSADNYVQDPFSTQNFNRYSYVLNNPLSYNDPEGHFWNFVIGGVLGGVSGWQVGKAQGAKGWRMAGYIFAGAGIGVATAGVGNAVLGAFSGAAQAGLGSTWASVGAYAASGAASGAFSGGAFAALGGQNIGKGALMGGLFGGAGGALGGYLKSNSFARSLSNPDNWLAQTEGPGDKIYAEITLKQEVIVKGKRYAPSSGFSGLGTAGTYAGNIEGMIGFAQIGMLSYRQSQPIHSRIGTYSRFASTYKGIGLAGKGLGAFANYVGAPANIASDYSSLMNGKISNGLFLYRTAGTGSAFAFGFTVGGPYGAAGGMIIGSGFTIGEQLYNGAAWWLKEAGTGIGNYVHAIKNGWIPH